MDKLLFFMSIIMSIACVMMAALFLSLRNKGLAVFITGIGSVKPMALIVALMVFAVLFLILAMRIALKMKK
ncbi:hypothetical protein [Anaerotignum sp.]